MAKTQNKGKELSLDELDQLLSTTQQVQTEDDSVSELEQILDQGQKKKPMGSPSASPQKKSFSDLKGQLISGPSASFGQLGNRLPSSAPLKEPELPSTQGEIFRAQPKPKPYNLKDKAWLEKNPVLWNSKQQIDEWENVKRNLEGGTKAAIGAIDYAFFGPLAADWAEHIVYAGAGLNEDYNKLSPEAKKIVKETVRGNAGMVGQTALGQEKLADFWFKESEKVLDTAIKREGDALTDMANFVEHPSVDSAKNLIYRGIESTAQTLPYMAATAVTGGSAGLILAGGMAAAEDARTQEKETGNRGLGYLLSNAYTGIAEGYFEKYTQGLLKKAGSLVKGDAKAAENLAKGFVESITEDFGVEGISEGLTTLTQELASKLALGEEIDGWDIARKVADATILGEFSGTGISVAGQAAGRGVQKSKEAINNYLATKLLTADQEKIISNNTNTINELRTQVSSPDTSPAVKAIANKKIAELEAENKGIKDQLYTAAEKLNVKGSVLLIGLDKALRSNRKEAEEIINDPSIDEPTKKLLLQDLLDEHNGLKQQKDALQKQTTDEISFQPEAGVSGEMAEGVPQAEPQGPTEEGQVEEVISLKPEDVSFGTAFDIQNSTAEETVGKEKDNWGDAQVWRERIENAGDILRELSSRGERPDPGYLLEKVTKLRNWIKSNKKYPSEAIPDDIKTVDDFNKTNLRFTSTVDGYEYLNKFYSDILGKTKKQYEEIPTYTKEQAIALDLILDLINNNIDGLESKLNDIENIANKIKQEGKLEIIPDIKLSKSAQLSETKTPTEEIKVEEVKVEEPKAEEKKPEVKKEKVAKPTIFTELDKGVEAEQRFDEVYKKRFEKTKDKLKAFGSARTALLKTDAYAAATRQQRLDMLSYLRNKYKLKMDTNLEATRAQMETSKQNTPEEIIATIKDYLSKAIQEGVKRGVKRTKEFFKEKRKAEKQLLSDTIEKIKKMIDKSSLKPSQAKAILNGLKLNLSNEKTMARYMERVDKIMKNVKYAEKLNEANDLKSKIKKLISDRNIAAQNQLARDFLTLSPDLSKNIDKYIEVANSVYDAIKRGQRTPTVIEDVEAYVSKAQAYEKELIKNTLEDIAEKAKAKLLKENQNLVDAGVLNADMTIDQINEYLYSINNLGEDNVEQAKEKKKVLLEQAKNLFDLLAPIAEMMVSEGIDPFTGEEIQIDKSTKDLINRLLDVDLDKISGAEAYRLVNSLQEFLVNGVVDDLEARLSAYEAINEAERLEKKGVKSTISTSKFMPLAFISKLWDINIKPLKSLLAKAFNGRIAGTEIFNSSGLRGVSLGSARAKKIASIIISKYDKMFKDRRPNGKAFDDASNTYERGIFAFLSRNINKATPEQTKAEFNRRMKLIGETIDNLRDTNKRDLIAMADVIDSIYSKIKKFGEEGSTEGSIDDVAKFIDPINQEAVNYWVEEFKNYYPEIKSVARTTYNTILEDDVDYTPDVFFRIVPDEKAYEPSGVLKMTSSLVKTKRSGSLLENKRTQSIRDVEDPTSNNLGVSFDFDLNMANTFQKTLVDIKTAPSILYFKNFVNSAAFNRMVPDSEVRKVLKDRMGSYADSIREKDGSNYEDIVKEADAIVRRISRYSTQRALGSISNIAKQTIPIFVNTFVNLNGSGDIAIFREGLRSISDPDIQKAIDESGYPIANRGLESQTSLDSADKLLKKANLNDKKSIFETIDELGQKRLESFLKKPDVYAARAAWVSYYLQEQKRKGVDINRIDWSQPLDKDSANYAEDMVDLQQNTSESSSMGKLFSSRAPGTSLVRQFLFGYASFVMNQKDKVYTDVGILFSNANKQEKEMAAKSLISTVAEMAAFEFVSMALSEVTMAIASSLVGGDDEDKETMMDRFNRIFKRSYTNMTASLLSPAPLLDRVVIYLLNQGITGATNLFPKEKEKKKKGDKKKDENFFYEDKGYATSPVTSALSYIGGAPGVAVRAGMSAFNNIQRIFASQYQDVFGNDVKFSNEDKAIIAAAFAFQILAAGNLLPSEADRIANSIVIEVEKGARKSKKKKWNPM